MRVVFFGTPAFAVPTLDRLLAAGHTVVAVVTQPDRPRGRGHHTSWSPVKSTATGAGVPVLQPTRLREPAFTDELRACSPEIGVVAAYGRLLPDAVLAIPPRGLLNVHASLLPRWRGAAPVHRSVMAGDTETGVTIMRVVAALDAGPMLARRAVPIGSDETSAELELQLAELGADLLVQTLGSPAIDQPGAVQDDRLVTYAPRVEKHESEVDWARPAADVHNRIRGLQPWPLAAVRFRGRRVLLIRSTLPADVPTVAEAPPATILRTVAGGFDVAAAGGSPVRILRVQVEGRAAVAAPDFVHGYHVTPGQRFDPLPTEP